MSKRVWGTVLFSLVLLVTVFLAARYMRRDAATPPEEQKGTELVELLPVRSIPDRAEPAEKETTESAEEDDLEDYEFILVDSDNYVAVYSLPENEIYEYTDVILDVLPEELKKEIRAGKYLRNEEELYNFLENYTS